VDGARELATHILMAVMLAIILGQFVLGTRFHRRLLAGLDADPRRRAVFYTMIIGYGGVRVAFVLLITFTSVDLTVADVGWAWPGGAIDYALAAWLLLVIGIGALRVRGAMARGRTLPLRADLAPLIPRTTRERRLAVVVAFAAGITEEALYRGLLIAAATTLYDLPLAAAVAASLVLFVGGHAYQGRRGMLGSAFVGGLFTALYLISGSLLLPIVVHIVQDLVALLVIPAHPSTPPPAEPIPARPPDAGPARARSGTTPPTVRSASPAGSDMDPHGAAGRPVG